MARRPKRRSPGKKPSGPKEAPELPKDVMDELPPLAQNYIDALRERLRQLEAENEKLKAALGQDSSNSNRPPSSDSPFRRRPRSASPRKPGGKPGHPGHRRPKLVPSRTEHVVPSCCEKCGHSDLRSPVACGEQQVLELPLLEVIATSFLLYKATCPVCGKVTRAELPAEGQAAYGPRLTAFLAMLMGPDGMSRRALQRLCSSTFGFPISLGGLQKIDSRASKAIEPHHHAIAHVVQDAAAANIDETTFAQQRSLQWLWVMATTSEVLFRLLPKRSKTAFEELIGP